MIGDERIRDFIYSLEAGQGELRDAIAREAVADRVPIIKKETGAFLKTLVAMKQPRACLLYTSTFLRHFPHLCGGG